MSSHNIPTGSLTVPFAVAAKLTADPAARINLPAFLTVVVDHFIAFGRRIECAPHARGAATEPPLPVPAHVRRHYARYAKAAGGRSIADLVSAALACHYFGAN